MSNIVKIALVQFESFINEPEKNAQKACAQVGEAAQNGAKIVCFPELFSTGYQLDLIGPHLPRTAETLEGNTITSLRRAAKENGVYVIAPIALEREMKGVPYNTAVVIDDQGEIMGTYDKHHPCFTEGCYFRAGTEFPVFETKYGKIGIIICYDMGFCEPARILALKGAEIIFCPSAWRVQDEDIWDLNIPQRALENQLFLAAVNRYGHEGELYMFGGSKVADARGRIIAKSTKAAEEIIYAECDLDTSSIERQNLGYLRNRRPGNYREIIEL